MILTDVDSGAIKSRIVVLIFVNYYLPGYRGGGPARTIANMVASLGDEFAFRIITMDRDFGDNCPYNSVKVDAWNQVGHAQVFYASPSARSLVHMARLIRETPHDILYLNSFFNTVFTIKPLIARKLRLVPRKPVVLAPRGEFSAGALQIKRWKKAPFMRLVRWLGVFDNIFWHASTSFECADIERAMQINRAYINLARNIAIARETEEQSSTSQSIECKSQVREGGVLSVCFLSRIAPMKNLDFALKVLALIKTPTQFHIYGPKEMPAYWAECEALIGQLPHNVQVFYRGSVENDQVCATLSKHDLFFVPSRGENFGHVFVEALSAGLPILVSDQTPWRDLKMKQVGWDIPLAQPDQFVRAIEEAAACDAQTRVKTRANCIRFARAIADDSEGLAMNRNLFLKAANRTELVNL